MFTLLNAGAAHSILTTFDRILLCVAHLLNLHLFHAYGSLVVFAVLLTSAGPTPPFLPRVPFIPHFMWPGPCSIILCCSISPAGGSLPHCRYRLPSTIHSFRLRSTALRHSSFRLVPSAPVYRAFPPLTLHCGCVLGLRYSNRGSFRRSDLISSGRAILLVSLAHLEASAGSRPFAPLPL